jgi:tetratricopeptide (TPR) repeat protein
VLGDGLSADKGRAYEFELALAQVYRGAGLMEKAQKAFEEAMKLSPKAEEPKEGLGRVLLARSREKELLERLKPEKDARKVALVRGIAWSRLNDPRRARQELAATQVGGKYPAEAAVYLALSDAAEEQATDKTIAALEKLVTQTRRNKATVQVALARVYMKAGALDKAKAQLEEAAKDPADYEGNSLLGELLLQLPGVPEEVALEPLQRAVDRNGSHAPSRHLLARTLLSLGRGPEAMKQIEAWTLDNPALDQAWKDAALVELETGHAKEAEASITRAVRADSDDVEGFRLKARVLFARGDGKGAFAALERANKLNAQDAETFCEIGHAFVRQGSPDLAQKAYEAAVKADAKSVCGQVGPWHAHPAAKGKAPLQALLKNAVHAWDKAFIDATLARCLAEEKDYKAALASAEDAIAVGPASAPAWFALGEVARRQKNEARALEAYGNAAGFDQSWSQARLAYADSLLKSGGDNLPKAADEYEAVTQYSQNDGDLMRAKNTARALRKQLK